MITITENIYNDVAQLLMQHIGDEHIFNGTVEYDAEEFYSALTCTLIICRDSNDGRILSILPVWWEFRLNMEAGDELNDFSWQELNAHLEKLI